MFSKYNYTRYYMINSIIHHLNPIFKIVLLIIILGTILFINSLIDIVIVGLFLLLIMLLSKVKITYYLKNILTLKILILFIIIIYLIVGYNILNIIFIVFKIIFVVLSSSILTYTTPPTEITYGLEIILKPLKKILPIKEMALSITLALRFIPSITNEAMRIIKAQASRGIDFYHSNLKKKLESISLIFVPMFVLSMRRADDIADVMNVRLYNYYDERTNYRMNKWSYLDFVILFFSVIMIVLIIIF